MSLELKLNGACQQLCGFLDTLDSQSLTPSASDTPRKSSQETDEVVTKTTQDVTRQRNEINIPSKANRELELSINSKRKLGTNGYKERYLEALAKGPNLSQFELSSIFVPTVRFSYDPNAPDPMIIVSVKAGYSDIFAETYRSHVRHAHVLRKEQSNSLNCAATAYCALDHIFTLLYKYGSKNVETRWAKWTSLQIVPASLLCWIFSRFDDYEYKNDLFDVDVQLSTETLLSLLSKSRFCLFSIDYPQSDVDVFVDTKWMDNVKSFVQSETQNISNNLKSTLRYTSTM